MMFNSVEELSAFIADKLEGDYDYDTHVDAIAEIALAAFNFAASELGASGYTASIAELQFLAKSRRIDGPFAVVKAQDMLYPQYDIPSQVNRYLTSWTPWAAQEAKRKLVETDHAVADSVRARWEQLAAKAED